MHAPERRVFGIAALAAAGEIGREARQRLGAEDRAQGRVRGVEREAQRLVEHLAAVLFEGQPQEGAWVRVYSALVDERGAAILVGEGAAGADGAFEIGVPDLVADVVNPNPP